MRFTNKLRYAIQVPGRSPLGRGLPGLAHHVVVAYEYRKGDTFEHAVTKEKGTDPCARCGSGVLHMELISIAGSESGNSACA